MAKMIPNVISEDSSSGEKKMFERLKELPDNYVVIHSLKMLKHINKVEGEIDFVIVCPYGILCMEVKGGRVERKNGIWIFRDRYGNENKKKEGPYEQVSNNMYSLIEYFKAKTKNSTINILNIQFGYAVAFPDIEFPRQDIDMEKMITIDVKDLKNKDMKNIIDNIYKYHIDKYYEKYKRNRKNLNDSEVNRISTILRGDFGYSQNLSSNLKETEDKLIKLTEEQKKIMESMYDNKRIFIKGTGGTGKTVLLYERALQLAALGKKVIFICYNKMLSKHLNLRLNREDVAIKNNLKIINLHAYMLEQIRKIDTTYIVEETNDFFEYKLPSDFENICCEKYDMMLVDEAQDLIKLQYINCLEKILNGGLKNGQWCMALDEKQSIYNSELKQLLEVIEDDIRPVNAKLNKNCRNTMQITQKNIEVTGIEQSINKEAVGEEVEIVRYSNEISQRNNIKRIIKRLKMNGIKNNEIVILSKHNYEESVFKGKNFLSEIAKVRKINEYIEESDDSIIFSTIHSFKGLESKIVLLCDVDDIEGTNAKMLNYVAISRAKLLLYILCDEKVKL